MPLACKHHPTCSPGMIPRPSETWHGFVFPRGSLLWGLMSWAVKLPEKSLTCSHLLQPDLGGDCAFGSLSSSIKWWLELVILGTTAVVKVKWESKNFGFCSQDHNEPRGMWVCLTKDIASTSICLDVSIWRSHWPPISPQDEYHHEVQLEQSLLAPPLLHNPSSLPSTSRVCLRSLRSSQTSLDKNSYSIRMEGTFDHNCIVRKL